MNDAVPHIVFDGPSASGKSTIARLIAQHLQWHFLPSGMIYRFYAYARTRRLPMDSVSKLEFTLADDSFHVSYQGEDFTNILLADDVAREASKIAKLPQVRSDLLELQRDYLIAPGMVAEGRDMASVVFPDADLKFYVDADPHIRAKRRTKQLNDSGFDANVRDVEERLKDRDTNDRTRAAAPLAIDPQSIRLDSGVYTPKQLMEQVLECMQSNGILQ